MSKGLLLIAAASLFGGITIGLINDRFVRNSVRRPDSGTNPENGKPVRRSVGFFGRNTIFAPDGTPYMTRYWLGRLRMHVFHRGDLDDDPHDHPWDFWTFPLTSYVEEVTVFDNEAYLEEIGKLTFEEWVEHQEGKREVKAYTKRRQIVPAWHWTFRPATHCHRVLGKWGGKSHDQWARRAPSFVEGKMITIVWRSPEYRRWGFLKHRDGRWCWQHWKEYVLGGGKDAPCQ